MSRRRAFTLVELLTVIAIISILIALLLPALKAAKRQVEKVACASNLRQVGLALLSYAQDNKGRFPLPSNRFSNERADWLYWQAGRDISQSRLWPYLGKSAKVLVCPSGLGRTITAGEYPFSYTLNQYASHTSLPDGSSVRMTLTKVREPAHKLMLVEENSLACRSGMWERATGIDRIPYLSVRHDLDSEYGGRAPWWAADIGSGHGISFDGSYLWIKRHWAWLPYYYEPLYVGPLNPLYP